MARGVVCPYCKSSLEGDVELDERVECPECDKSFTVRENMIEEYHKLNPTLAKRFGMGTLKVVGAIVGLIVSLLIIAYLQTHVFTEPTPTQTAVSQPQITSIDTSSSPQRRASKFAADKIAEYEIAKRNGDKMQACVLAGIIKQAFLTAQDEQHYNIWRVTEETRCEEAGVPKAK